MEEEKDIKLDPAQLHFRGNFDKQVVEIFKYIRMPTRRVKNLKKLFVKLEDTLNILFEGCHVKVFGSIVMGLALKTSDVDCLIDNCSEDPKTCIERTVAYFKEYPHIFKKVNVKTNKKLSVITVFDDEFKISCDISFSGPRAVTIGQLVSYLLKMDQRALPLTILIKYWAKVHNISGPKLLPSNALIFLVIFFLQDKSILPPVALLQENLTPKVIDGWNVAFAPITYSSYNTDSLHCLLGEFFDFYSDFDFANLIVSTYLGFPVERRHFLEVNNVPSEFTFYKQTGEHSEESIRALTPPICVQCPFDHSRNISIAVKQALANKILHDFKHAAHMYETCSESAFLPRILQKVTFPKSVPALPASRCYGHASGRSPRGRAHARQAQASRAARPARNPARAAGERRRSR